MAPNWCNVIFRDLMCRPKYLVSFSHIYKVEVKIFKFEDEKMMIFFPNLESHNFRHQNWT